ncbi:hypothetical protein GQ55_2G205000 [Panicum hallii var. hallii]|uniref:Myb/SANT-like domain-containing protein n=1 Tax=Panicum hallii var. hallii TaxID=1504633 RepID=A0A2T7EQR5_9POAL|nr:hypothetical protein GQ55_2G205000 [Panicum hallii var. hallii]
MENMPTPKTRKPNAQWDSNAAKIFNEICVEQVLANNRPQGCLNNKGYANLIKQFNERTGRNYTRVQMKNRWDALKADFTTWKTLLLSASGLGRDPKTGTIAASNDWWEEKIEAMPLCKKFRFAPLENEEDVEIMFSGASCTNANAVAPGAREGSADNGSEDVQEVHPSSAEKQPAKRAAAYKSPKKPKKNFRDMQQEIAEMLQSVIEAGACEGSDEHFYATQLLIKKEFRDVFVTLKTPEGKLGWLKRTWEERKKR